MSSFLMPKRSSYTIPPSVFHSRWAREPFALVQVMGSTCLAFWSLVVTKHIQLGSPNVMAVVEKYPPKYDASEAMFCERRRYLPLGPLSQGGG